LFYKFNKKIVSIIETKTFPWPVRITQRRFWFTHECFYVLECHGGRYYVGVSQNLPHRFAQHFLAVAEAK
jgi:hypothetical protein